MPVLKNYPSTPYGSSVGEFTRYGAESADWEALKTNNTTDYLYDSSISSRTWQEHYTDDIDQSYVGVSPTGGQGSQIESIIVYARCKQDANDTPATVALSHRDATGTRHESAAKNLTTSWAWYTEEWTTYSSGVPLDFGFYPDNLATAAASELQIGFGLEHGTVGAFCSELYVTIKFKNAYSYLTSTPIGIVTPDITRDHKMGRVLTGGIGLNPSTSRNATYGRVFSPIPMAMTGTIIAERNLGTWLVVASADSGSYKTRDGSSWSSAAKSASLDPLPASYLEQFDNRLVVLKGENSGFAYSAKNDPITNWTHKPNFPNQPISFTGLFVGRDASDTPALYFLAEDGVYYLDVFEQFTFGKTELSWEKNSNSGKKGIYFKGATYVAVDRGIYELQGGIALPIGPDQDDGVPVDMSGYVSDLIGVGFWLVISINGGAGSKSTIMKRHIAGKHWHTVYKTASANSQINTIAWDNGVLYFGEDTNVKSIPLSADSDNV